METPDGAVADGAVVDGAPVPDAEPEEQAALAFHDIPAGGRRHLGELTVGQTGMPVTLEVRNRSTAAVGPLAVTVTGDRADVVVDDTDCRGTDLRPDRECDILVRARPTAAGLRTATITVADSDDPAVTASVDVTMTGLAPGALVVEPAQHDFARVRIGQTASRTFRVRNSGGSPVAGLRLEVPADRGYSVAPGTCTATLAAGASCEATVTFRPVLGGGADVSLAANADGAQAAAQLVGRGVGTINVTKTGDGAALGVVEAPGLTCSSLRCTAEVDQPSIRLRPRAPREQARFAGWDVACGDKSDDCLLAIDRPTRDVSVTFRQQLRLQVTVGGSGVVTAPGLLCTGTTCTGYYDRGAQVAISPQWTGTGRHRIATTGCALDGGVCAVAMTEAKNVAITFVQRYLVTAAMVHLQTPLNSDLLEEPRGAGTIDVTGVGRPAVPSREFDAGASLTLHAYDYPDLHSQFDRWSEGPCRSAGPACTFRVTSDVTVTAYFRRAWPLAIHVSGEEGRVRVEPAGQSCTRASHCYSTPTRVRLIAESTRCWQFERWGNDCGGTAGATCDLNVDGPRRVGAIFQQRQTRDCVGGDD